MPFIVSGWVVAESNPVPVNADKSGRAVEKGLTLSRRSTER